MDTIKKKVAEVVFCVGRCCAFHISLKLRGPMLCCNWSTLQVLLCAHPTLFFFWTARRIYVHKSSISRASAPNYVTVPHRSVTVPMDRFCASCPGTHWVFSPQNFLLYQSALSNPSWGISLSQNKWTSNTAHARTPCVAVAVPFIQSFLALQFQNK